jgi:hypothetical protein
MSCVLDTSMSETTNAKAQLEPYATKFFSRILCSATRLSSWSNGTPSSLGAASDFVDVL